MRPKLGIGVAVGAAILFASQASGSDPMLGLVLGGGVGIALGLTGRPAEERLTVEDEAPEEENR